MRYGVVLPIMLRVEAMIEGSDSSVSITEMSSAAWTMGQTVWVMKSNRPFGTGFRFSSVKKESMPPPNAMPGNSFRAAAAISS